MNRKKASLPLRVASTALLLSILTGCGSALRATIPGYDKPTGQFVVIDNRADKRDGNLERYGGGYILGDSAVDPKPSVIVSAWLDSKRPGYIVGREVELTGFEIEVSGPVGPSGARGPFYYPGAHPGGVFLGHLIIGGIQSARSMTPVTVSIQIRNGGKTYRYTSNQQHRAGASEENIAAQVSKTLDELLRNPIITD